MKLIITIDTEEDNWGVFSPTGHTLKNLDRIPVLQELFDAYNVNPTYLITYPVATDTKSIGLLREIEKSGRCEIGTHCHPWNTPPFDEVPGDYNSMLCNLPGDLQYNKLSSLNDTIIKNFDIKPVSFRGGRWGFNEQVARNLCRLGYKIDTSITPFISWSDSLGPDFTDVPPDPFWFSFKDLTQEAGAGRLLEIPTSIGYLQQNFALCNLIFKLLSKNLISRSRLIGILDKLNILNKVWLTPELSDGRRMIKLAQSLMKKDYQFINMFFHSTTLTAGLTHFIKNSDEEKQFIQRIEDFLIFARNSGIESIKLADTTDLFPI